jgi:hypothetical protein
VRPILLDQLLAQATLSGDPSVGLLACGSQQAILFSVARPAAHWASPAAAGR